MSNSEPLSDPTIDEIYAQLTRGLAHERVNDDNVFALIERAERDGHTVLATELREWQSPCGGGEAPSGGDAAAKG